MPIQDILPPVGPLPRVPEQPPHPQRRDQPAYRDALKRVIPENRPRPESKPETTPPEKTQHERTPNEPVSHSTEIPRKNSEPKDAPHRTSSEEVSAKQTDDRSAKGIPPQTEVPRADEQTNFTPQPIDTPENPDVVPPPVGFGTALSKQEPGLAENSIVTVVLDSDVTLTPPAHFFPTPSHSTETEGQVVSDLPTGQVADVQVVVDQVLGVQKPPIQVPGDQVQNNPLPAEPVSGNQIPVNHNPDDQPAGEGKTFGLPYFQDGVIFGLPGSQEPKNESRPYPIDRELNVDPKKQTANSKEPTIAKAVNSSTNSEIATELTHPIQKSNLTGPGITADTFRNTEPSKSDKGIQTGKTALSRPDENSFVINGTDYGSASNANQAGVYSGPEPVHSETTPKPTTTVPTATPITHNIDPNRADQHQSPTPVSQTNSSVSTGNVPLATDDNSVAKASHPEARKQQETIPPQSINPAAEKSLPVSRISSSQIQNVSRKGAPNSQPTDDESVDPQEKPNLGKESTEQIRLSTKPAEARTQRSRIEETEDFPNPTGSLPAGRPFNDPVGQIPIPNPVKTPVDFPKPAPVESRPEIEPVDRAQPSTALNAEVSQPAPKTEGTERPAGTAKVATPQKAEFAERVLDAVQQSYRQNRPFRIRLHPPELGSLQVEIRQEGGAFSARLDVENPSAHQALTDHLSELKQALNRNGVALDRIDVQINAQRSEGEARQHAESDSQQQRDSHQRDRDSNSGRGNRDNADEFPDEEFLAENNPLNQTSDEVDAQV